MAPRNNRNKKTASTNKGRKRNNLINNERNETVEVEIHDPPHSVSARSVSTRRTRSTSTGTSKISSKSTVPRPNENNMRSTEPPLSNNAKQPNPNNDTTMTNDINQIMVCEQNLDEIDDHPIKKFNTFS